MTRILVMSICLAAAACDVGEIPINGAQVDGGGGGSDTGGGSNDAAGNGCVAAVTPAPPKHLHITGGTSNKGQNCMAGAACHGTGSGRVFTFSGTVFAATTGTAPNPGAQVRVKFGAMVLSVTTDEDGNFSSTQAVTYPATTNATKCPSVTPMVSNLVTGNGQCNSCHVTGGTTAQLVIN